MTVVTPSELAPPRAELDAPSSVGGSARRSGLVAKYALLFVAVVFFALATNGALDVWFLYQEHRATLIRFQRQQAETAAGKIEQFVKDIESQIGWTVQFQWAGATPEQRRSDGLRLLRQVPAITELAQIDPSGREQLRLSRISSDVIGSGSDFSQDPRFTAPLAGQAYYGPVYFRRESEPYMTVSLRGSRRDTGVSAAEVNLKFMWDVVSQIAVGRDGDAYVVDSRGRLIAHPNISLVLRNTDLSLLPQVRAALSAPHEPSVTDVMRDVEGREVLTAHAPIDVLGWHVFVDLPAAEANEPLVASLRRTALVLLAALGLAFLAGVLLARRMVVPIRTIQAGAARIGAGELDQRISVSTNDELEGLADQFNAMAGQLRESYAGLEQKVKDRTAELESRTRELGRSVDELRALGEVSQALNSTLDLDTVLERIVAKATEISDAGAGSIYVYDEAAGRYYLRADHGLDEATAAHLRSEGLGPQERVVAEAARTRRPFEIADLAGERRSAVEQMIYTAGYRALLVVPMMHAEVMLGALVIRRTMPGAFPPNTVELLSTFAAQSVVAITNAALFRELDQKSRDLLLASQHKSQFLANMSHELRTPLNAILGYTELIVDGIYGPVSPKVRDVLDRVQTNGKHLLELINDVLDLSKIEAGQLTLSPSEFSVEGMVDAAVTALEPLAREKNLALGVDMAPALPVALGDERRLSQVLLNLLGNAIKFTEAGRIRVEARTLTGRLVISVSDTGPGIAKSEQTKIFEEFQQVDNSSTRKKGGTGLGLAISKRIVEMHGGTLWLESDEGLGSTFYFSVPLHGPGTVNT